MNSKISLLIMAFISLAFISIPARAEVGNLNITNHSFMTYSHGENGELAQAQTWTQFYVFNSWNQIEQIFIDASAASLSFATDGQSSSFHCVAGCTGGGTFSYSKNSKALAWYFTNPTTVTSSPITIAYDSNPNIANDITAGAFGFPTTSDSTLIGEPVYYRITGNSKSWTTTGAGQSIVYNVVVDSSIGNRYNITYPGSGLFETNITKAGQTTVNTRVIIENATGTPINYTVQGDPLGAYNNNNFDVVNSYGQGIALNISAANGDFNRVVVNTTSSSIVTPTPAPTPITPIPASGNYIIPDSSLYTLNSASTLFWGVDSSILNVLRQIDIDVLRPDGTYQNIASNVQTNSINNGSVIFQLTQSGKYQAQLDTCLVTCAFYSIPNKVVLATVQLNVSTPKPYIIAPAQVLANQQFTVSYSFGQNPLSSFSYGYIDIFNTNSGQHESSVSAVLDNNPHSITNFTLPSSTTYVLCLGLTGQLTSTCTTVISATGTLPPTKNISTSVVQIAKSNYWFQDTLTGFYAIDNTNYSRSDNSTLFWDIYNTDKGIESMYGYVGSQAENFSLLIQNDPLHYVWDGKNTYLPSQFYAGNNQFRIFAKNSTTTTQIVNGTFTIGTTDTSGFGLSLSKYTVAPSEPFTIFVTAPSPGKVTIIPQLNAANIQSLPIPGTIALQASIVDVGTASIYLYDSNNTLHSTAIVNVTTVVVTPTIPGGNPSGQQAISVFDGWVSLLGFGVNPVSKFFFAWLITTVFIIGGFAMTKGNLLGGTILGGGSWGWFMFLGYLPVWFAIIVVLQIALATKWFR